MEKKKKVIFYIGWTDCLAHLTGDEAYTEGNSQKEKRKYTRGQVKRFFNALRNLKQKYDVDIHCITGGTVKYLEGDTGWISQVTELFRSQGCGENLKSVVTEYGGDILLPRITENDDVTKRTTGEKANISILQKKRPFAPSKVLCTDDLIKRIKASIPKGVDPSAVEVTHCDYFVNIRFLDEKMTQSQFEAYYAIISSFEGNEEFELYPYYCPGYGVEIDVLPKGLDKARAVETINEQFYKNTPREEVALQVFNGDFPDIDLRMVDKSMTQDVLFVGSHDTNNLSQYVGGTGLKYFALEHKVGAISLAMEDIYRQNLDKYPHTYDKENYKYGK